MTTTQLLAKLKRLASDARTNLYERVKIAAEVLRDLDWIAQSFDGDQAKAEEAIGQDYFADIGRMYSLGTLLAVLKRFPTKASWIEYRYDIHALVAIWRSEIPHDQDQPLKKRRTATVAELDAANERIAELERELAAAKRENAALHAEVKALCEAMTRERQVA